MNAKKEIGAHALLVTSDAKILLVKKGAQYLHDKNNAGKIAMFGGGVESGEDVATALRRELLEELNLDIKDFKIKKLNVYNKTEEQDGCEVEVHVFTVDGVHPDTLVLREGDKEDIGEALDENKAIIIESPEELLNKANLTRITKLALEDFIKSK